jgi:uncharacterized protein YoaH (UPF0181 family)
VLGHLEVALEKTRYSKIERVKELMATGMSVKDIT